MGSAVDWKKLMVVAMPKPTYRPNGSHRRTSTERTFLAPRHQTVPWREVVPVARAYNTLLGTPAELEGFHFARGGRSKCSRLIGGRTPSSDVPEMPHAPMSTVAVQAAGAASRTCGRHGECSPASRRQRLGLGVQRCLR